MVLKPNLEFKFDDEKAGRSAGTMRNCERCTRNTGIQHRRDLSNNIVKEWGRCGHCDHSFTRYREIFTDDPHKQVVSITDHNQ